MGYWGDPEATRATFLPSGWLRTGDQFHVSRSGVFYFVDRMKDTLKVSGAQVSPSEIESVVLAHPDRLVKDVAVAGVPSTSKDEKVPRAWLVLSNAGLVLGASETSYKIDHWVKQQLSRYKWLTGGMEIVEEIPKNPTGKVLKRVLVDNYVSVRRSQRVTGERTFSQSKL